MKARYYHLTTIILLLVLAYGVSSVHAVGFLSTVPDPMNFTVAEDATFVGFILVDPGSISNANQVTVSVTGTDARFFRIIFFSESNLVLLMFFNHMPDYETKRSYTFQISIDEPGDADGADTITVNVRITRPIPTPTINGIPATPSTRTDIQRRTVHRCGLGWAPQSLYTHHLQQPKAMMYALEFKFDDIGRGQYTCTTIEIRTGDPTLTHLDGWKLYLGTRYNPSYVPIHLTQANSQINNGVLRITPEMVGLERFACSTAYLIGQPAPSVDYTLKNENNLTVDRAYSCYLWGQVATTQDNGVWKKSERRFLSQVLRAMDTPRIERYISKPDSIHITYMRIEDFQWDHFVLSDWLLASPSEETEVVGGNAPSAYRKPTTSWAALKKNQRQ